MKFKYIDIDNWKRKEYFYYYYKNVKCTFTMNAELDITELKINLKEKNIKLYPVEISAYKTSLCLIINNFIRSHFFISVNIMNKNRGMTDTIISLCPGVLFPILIIFTIFEYTIFKITVAITHIVRKVSDTVIFRTNIDVTPCQPSVCSRQPLFRPFFIFEYIFQTLGIFSQFPLHTQII